MLPSSPPIRDALRALYDAIAAPWVDADSAPDGGFDPTFVDRTSPLLGFFYDRYFRIRLEGMQNIPGNGPALIVANHSGGVPWDGAMLIHAFRRHHPQHRFLRTLVATFAFRARLSAPVIAKIGGVRASMENGLRLLRNGELVAAFPEGLRGVGKLYRERYRLNHFGRGGFVRLARAAGVPVIPIAIIGAEEIHPILGKMTTLARPLGLPYIPITPTFPFLGPLGLLPVPTKWRIKIGTPVEIPADSDTLEQAEAIRRQMDRMIADMLVERRSIIFG